MENERFELQNVEMAASSSKMLQIARKTDRTADKKNPKREKQIRKQFRTLLWAYDEPFHQLSLTMYNPDIWVSLKMGGFDAANLG